MRAIITTIACCLVGFLSVSDVRADAIVLSNRSPEAVAFRITPQNRLETSHSVRTKDLVSFLVDGPLGLTYNDGKAKQKLLLEPNSVCFFHRSKTGELTLSQIGFSALPGANPEDPALDPPIEATTPETPAQAKPDPFSSDVCKVPVKIYVDEEEPYVRSVWEKRLRDRVRKASDIIEQHCFVRFEVVAVGEWESNDEELEFAKMLAEFEREAPVEPAALAIGFSSQRRRSQPRIRLGATFAPLRQHILIREWSKTISEPERMEILLHELGHYLGATHSPELDSAMRPMLNDGKANLRSFRIGYDPVNTLVMCLVGEEIRQHNVRRLDQLTMKTRRQLAAVYLEISKVTPDEPATLRMLQLLSGKKIPPQTIPPANGEKPAGENPQPSEN